MIKLFVSDIDGTLFDHTVGVPKENVDALLKLQEKDVKIVLASGRAIPAMMEIADRIHLKANKGYIIASNGAEVFDLSKGEYIHQALIPLNTLKKIYTFCMMNKLYFSCVQDDVLYYSYYDQAIEHEKYHGNFKIKHIQHIDDIKKDSPKCSINIAIDSDTKDMDQFEKEFKSVVSIERLMPWYMDVQSIGQSKKLGLEKLCQTLSIELDEVAAIGDGVNDKTMLEIVGLSASLKNANQVIQDCVDHIMPSAKDAGVAHFAQLILKQNAL